MTNTFIIQRHSFQSIYVILCPLANYFLSHKKSMEMKLMMWYTALLFSTIYEKVNVLVFLVQYFFCIFADIRLLIFMLLSNRHHVVQALWICLMHHLIEDLVVGKNSV